MSVCPTILVVDDEKNTRDGVVQFLEGLSYDVISAASGEEAFELFKAEKPDLVLTDVRMPGLSGTELLEKIKAERHNAAVILLTAYGSVEDAVKAMKKGAYYYLTKPVNLDELEFLTKKALASKSLEQENKELKAALFKEKFDSGAILTQSPLMKKILETAEQIAQSNATVLIEGESGTGKELMAHRIHELSQRKAKTFVPVHCASLTDTLLPSELFGHEKGAFTGATDRKIGRFERAHGGTLFLDEIGEISQETQIKLLRVLQESEIERVGGTKTIKVDVRLILATNKKLSDEVAKGNFREDLYYRINVIYLKMPPLRERKEDIPLLAKHFIEQFSRQNHKKISGLDDEALKALAAYDWPGNIRELKNIIERMVVLATGKTLTLRNIPDDLRTSANRKEDEPSLDQIGSPQHENLEAMEKMMIKRTLAAVEGNKSLAAKKLGISRRTLYRKLDEYELD